MKSATRRIIVAILLFEEEHLAVVQCLRIREISNIYKSLAIFFQALSLEQFYF